jgi:hypothetical protein
MDAWKLDNFRKISTKEFTFNNGRFDAHLAILCLDKFLVSQDLDTRGGRIEVATLIHKLSDHSPLVLTIWGQLVVPGKLNHYFDSSLLGDEKGRAAMLSSLGWGITQAHK